MIVSCLLFDITSLGNCVLIFCWFFVVVAFDSFFPYASSFAGLHFTERSEVRQSNACLAEKADRFDLCE